MLVNVPLVLVIVPLVLVIVPLVLVIVLDLDLAKMERREYASIKVK